MFGHCNLYTSSELQCISCTACMCSFNSTENLDLTVTPEQREPLQLLQGRPAYIAAMTFCSVCCLWQKIHNICMYSLVEKPPSNYCPLMRLPCTALYTLHKGEREGEVVMQGVFTCEISCLSTAKQLTCMHTHTCT